MDTTNVLNTAWWMSDDYCRKVRENAITLHNLDNDSNSELTDDVWMDEYCRKVRENWEILCQLK